MHRLRSSKICLENRSVETYSLVLVFVKLSSILMISSTYQEGYKNGYEDAHNGKPKHPRPAFTKSLLSQSYISEFIKGYNHGYNSRLLQERKEWARQNARDGHER